jgi:hypothetical protein
MTAGDWKRNRQVAKDAKSEPGREKMRVQDVLIEPERAKTRSC